MHKQEEEEEKENFFDLTKKNFKLFDWVWKKKKKKKNKNKIFHF